MDKKSESEMRNAPFHTKKSIYTCTYKTYYWHKISEEGPRGKQNKKKTRRRKPQATSKENGRKAKKSFINTRRVVACLYTPTARVVGAKSARAPLPANMGLDVGATMPSSVLTTVFLLMIFPSEVTTVTVVLEMEPSMA